MTINTFLWTILVFWVVVYAIRATRKQRNSSLLPTDRLSSRSNSFGNSKGCKVTVQNFHLKVETRSFNERHSSLADFLAEATHRRRLRAALRVFYNVGSVFGTIGLISGLAILLFTCFSFVWNIWAVPIDPTTSKMHVKRDVSSLGSEDEMAKSAFGINPIIPGVTVPLSHLPFLLFALFSSQCIHEAGHAIAAAIDAVPLHSVGASLTLVLPSAFVSLSPSLNTYKASARLRIIAAGAWHNLVLCAIVWLVSSMGAGKVWTKIGWQDTSNIGTVVLDVDPDSALAYHLRPGAMITALDDVHLASEGKPEDSWAHYLSSTSKMKHALSQGWCIDAALFNEQSTTCCNKNSSIHSPSAHLSCFETTEGSGRGRCLDPVMLFSPLPPDVSLFMGRCSSRNDCKTDLNECVTLASREDILRIHVKPPIWENEGGGESVVLWSGPSTEVLEQVTVGILSPQIIYFPLWLPDKFALFFYYLSTLSFSLYIFNLFALPFLDGSHLLSALLDLLQPEEGSYTNDIPLDVMTDAERGDYKSKKRFTPRTHSDWRIWFWRRRLKFERSVKYTTIVLMILTAANVALSTLRE